METHKEKSESFDAGKFAERITLELTNSCNLRCTFCPRHCMAKHQGFLDVELAKRLIDEMANYSPVSVVPFFRGEPLLHPGWPKLLAYMKKKGLGPLQLTTNATLMDEEAARKLIEIEVDFISFSMDTLDSSRYEAARRGANYSVVVANIMMLLAMKEKMGSRYPEVQISAIDIPEYRQGMDDFVAFWRSKVDRVRVYIEHSQDGHPGSIAEALPYFEKRLPCRKVFTDMVILWDGEVALCNHDWTREKGQQIGTVTESSIAEIWNSERYREIREMHHEGNLADEPLCEHCDHWKMYYLPEGYLGRLYKREIA